MARRHAPLSDYYAIKPVRVPIEILEKSPGFDLNLAGSHYKVSVVNKESPLVIRTAVEYIAYYFRREFDYDFVQYEATEKDEKYRAYLWTDTMTGFDDGKLTPIGACCWRWRNYSDAPAAYAMQWIWLHPYVRRTGLLSETWPCFVETFKPRFYVEPPLSDAMAEFLRKHKFEQPGFP